MSISFRKYIDITSGVAAAVAVRERDLILRIFTSSQYIGPGQVLEFSADMASQIAERFGGTSSTEYRMAMQYFGYVSPRMTTPQSLSFASWQPTSRGGAVYGNPRYKALTLFTAANAGALKISVGDSSTAITGIDLSTVTSLADAATVIQTAIIAAGIVGASLTVSTSRFILTVPDFAKVTVSPLVSGANDLASAMDLTVENGAFGVVGSEAVPPAAAVIASVEITNNFGSIAFAQTLDVAQMDAVAAYTSAQNLMYQYYVPVLRATMDAVQTALASYAGVGITLSPFANEWPELIPAATMAATRYNMRASVQNYMYRQQAGISSSVSDTAESNALDAKRVNYYGDTSSAGQKIAFYQRGTLQGVGAAPTDMNVYANEQWFKDAAGAALLKLQLSVGRIPANAEGVGAISNTLQSVIDRALFNGTISTEKDLTPAQRIYLTQATGDELAWSKVQTQGYMLAVRIEPYATQSGTTEYKSVYEIFYSKDDAVRKIEGTHSLI